MEYVEVSGPVVPARLPSEYQEVEYIQSSGYQWIDTGIYPSSNTVSQFKFRNLEITGDVIYGYRAESDADDYRFFNYNSTAYFDTPNQGRIYGGSIVPDTDYELELGNYYIKDLVTGNNIATGSSASFGARSHTITLNYMQSSSTYSKNRFYYVKIYESGSLVRDLVPCYRKSDSKPGMYDLVSNNFLTNRNSGSDFTTGSAIIPEVPVSVVPAWNTVHQVVNSFTSLTISDIATPDDKTRVSVIKFSTGETVPTLSLPNTWNVYNLNNVEANKTYELVTAYRHMQPPRLPAAYQEVEYIQSSGTEYISVGLKSLAIDRISGKIEYTSLSESDAHTFCSTRSAESNAYRIYAVPTYDTSKGYHVWRQYCNDSNSVTSSRVYANTRYKIDAYIGDSSQYLRINGVQLLSTSVTMHTDSEVMNYICAWNGNGTVTPTFSGKVYYMKAWKGSNLLRSFIPCYRKSDSKPGMYDLVSETFFVNQGSGADFTVGPDAEKPIDCVCEQFS